MPHGSRDRRVLSSLTLELYSYYRTDQSTTSTNSRHTSVTFTIKLPAAPKHTAVKAAPKVRSDKRPEKPRRSAHPPAVPPVPVQSPTPSNTTQQELTTLGTTTKELAESVRLIQQQQQLIIESQRLQQHFITLLLLLLHLRPLHHQLLQLQPPKPDLLNHMSHQLHRPLERWHHLFAFRQLHLPPRLRHIDLADLDLADALHNVLNITDKLVLDLLYPPVSRLSMTRCFPEL